jgi:hypothetical protein
LNPSLPFSAATLAVHEPAAIPWNGLGVALQGHGSQPIVIRLTPKARAFLHAALRHAGLNDSSSGMPNIGIAVLRVPARPFLVPVFENYAQPAQTSRRFLERVDAQLRGDYGHV